AGRGEEGKRGLGELNSPLAQMQPSAPKIADFGLAKFITDSEVAVGVTRSGDLVGTPAYMAPEQALAKADQIGPATDLWALGVTRYEMLTGHLPFRGGAASDTRDQLRADDAE